ncbi:MAG: hypothetical protein C0410_13850 [Anaerolinea sp.]|nr:hypothetical protein [Anaerolinea sp.]
MKTNRIFWIICIFLILALSACGNNTTTPTMDVAAVSTIDALNLQLTQVAGTLNAVIAQQSATPFPTKTPAVTATATLTPSPTETATPLSGVRLIFDSATNCRIGPGINFSRVATVDAGVELQALARSEDDEFYYVRYFDTSNHYCWVWKGTSYQTDNPKILPVYTAQPTYAPTITPTSAASFTVTYNSLQTCSSTYFLVFNITNTGNMTWQSVKIVIVDDTEGKTVTHTSNYFTGYSGCSLTKQEGDLTTGEPGQSTTYNPGEFTYDPTGHSLMVTVSVYSEKGQTGTMQSRVISVKP